MNVYYYTTDGTKLSGLDYHHERERLLFSSLNNPDIIKSFLAEVHPEVKDETVPMELSDEFQQYVFSYVQQTLESKYTRKEEN